MIRKRVAVFVRISAKASIVINACQIHSDGNIKKDVKIAIATTPVRLATHAIYILVNACAEKDSLAVNAIDVQSVTLDIPHVNAAVAIVTVH